MNVAEARVTARVMINYFIICRFNVRLVAEKNAKTTNEATEAKVIQHQTRITSWDLLATEIILTRGL